MIIPYLGNKSKLSDFITPNVPENGSTYVDPFSGTFGVFFCLNFENYKNVRFVYNDLNHLNTNLFNQMRYNNEFISLIKSINVDDKLYKESLKLIYTEKDDVKLAIYWLIVLTCSCSHKICVNSWCGNSEFELFKLKYDAYKPFIDKITDIRNLDYKDVISEYDSEDTFFYIDPPYKDREKYYINDNFGYESNVELSDILKNIKGKFILNYFNFDGIKDLYTDYRFESIDTAFGVENIIMNF